MGQARYQAKCHPSCLILNRLKKYLCTKTLQVWCKIKISRIGWSSFLQPHVKSILITGMWQLCFVFWYTCLSTDKHSIFYLYNILVNRDFISATTLKIEFGLANEMDQHDRNFKVRQLLGAKEANPSAFLSRLSQNQN